MENLGLLLGILSVMMCPMVFGGITAIVSQQAQDKITDEVWEEWREDERFQKQPLTKSINYND